MKKGPEKVDVLAFVLV